LCLMKVVLQVDGFLVANFPIAEQDGDVSGHESQSPRFDQSTPGQWQLAPRTEPMTSSFRSSIILAHHVFHRTATPTTSTS
jgi:hypothetical protein